MIIANSFKNVIKSLVVDIITPCLIGFGVGTNTEDLFIIDLANSYYDEGYLTPGRKKITIESVETGGRRRRRKRKTKRKKNKKRRKRKRTKKKRRKR